jgi:hypothetical protein
MGEERGVHRVLVVKPEGKRPLGKPKRRWEDNIKMDVEEVEGGRGDWMELAQVASTCEYGKELSGSIKCENFLVSCENWSAFQEGLCSME